MAHAWPETPASDDTLIYQGIQGKVKAHPAQAQKNPHLTDPPANYYISN